MAQTAAHLVDHVIPHVPVRQRVLSLPIPLRLLLAAQPRLVTPVLQVVHRVITRFLLKQAGVKADEADSGAVTLIQRFGSAANLNVHLRCLVLDGVYRRGADGVPEFVEGPAPTDQALQAVLYKIITRTHRRPWPSRGTRWSEWKGCIRSMRSRRRSSCSSRWPTAPYWPEFRH
jgi:Putative transposase